MSNTETTSEISIIYHMYMKNHSLVIPYFLNACTFKLFWSDDQGSLKDGDREFHSDDSSDEEQFALNKSDFVEGYAFFDIL